MLNKKLITNHELSIPTTLNKATSPLISNRSHSVLCLRDTNKRGGGDL